MSVRRLEGVPGFAIDKVAAAAGSDPEVLRLENLDTDLRPPQEAIDATKAAVDRDDGNSYLPFTGSVELREAVSSHLKRLSGISYDPDTQIVIPCGGAQGMFDTILATADPGDEVVLTDPAYAGMIYRVKLAGATPVLVPFYVEDGEWRLDLDQLRDSITDKTRSLLMMSASMPCGAVLNGEEWEAVCQICRDRDIWLIYDAAMERIIYDNRPYIHPASLDGMEERAIILGSVSKEYRMIGWRVGWVAGPQEIIKQIAIVHIYNSVTPGGIGQAGATAALNSANDGVEEAVAEWERRRNAVVDQLSEYPVIRASGSWSLLVDVGQMGLDSFSASKMLLDSGRIAATPMRDWGDVNSDQFVRLVFSNEPVVRLETLKERFDQTF